MYISKIINNGVKGHKNYEFVDIDINTDTKLFIDPVLIEIDDSEWSKVSNKKIQSFADALYKAYRENDERKKRELLAHATEQNSTHFGFGNGHNGKGNTTEGLLKALRGIEEIVISIDSLKKISDLSVLTPNFAEDRLSDMLTNILHGQLNLFTREQADKFGIELKQSIRFWTWDEQNGWIKIEKPSLIIDGKEVLLVPKRIVRKSYLFRVEQYMQRIILERKQKEIFINSGQTVSKKDILSGKRLTGSHWIYEESVKYTKKHQDALNEYHERLPRFYIEQGGAMKDDVLDKLIYRHNTK